MESVNKQTFHIRDLDTSLVTFFPTRAQVSRVIKGVDLQPGSNEITVHGLSPTVEEDSIKVKGPGSSAVICDITVEQLPNQEHFKQLYPDHGGNDDTGSEFESENEQDSESKESPELKQTLADLKQLEVKRGAAAEAEENSTDCLQNLKTHIRTFAGTQQFYDELAKYNGARGPILEDKVTAALLSRNITTEIGEQRQRLTRLQRMEEKGKAAEKKGGFGNLALALRRERRRERNLERERVHQERMTFCPKYCQTLRILIEYSGCTPLPSHGQSHSSSPASESPRTADDAPNAKHDIVLTYVTSEAGWAPSYHLQLSTTNSTGSLCFDARLINRTSETWSGCKIVLSTSQAVFGGLDKTTPVLQPWNIRLQPDANADGILRSKEEITHHSDWLNINLPTRKSRYEMFVGREFRKRKFDDGAEDLLPLAKRMTGSFVPSQLSRKPASTIYARASRYGAATVAGAAMTKTGSFDRMDAETDASQGKDSCDDLEAAYDFQASLLAENDFTIEHELSGHRTLCPQTNATKQRVSQVSLSTVAFCHTVVAKLRPVVNLHAEVKNTSKLTILGGRVGITLDDNFMCLTNLPRCSAGESFTLHLGADSTIRVQYREPETQPLTPPMPSSEVRTKYTRSMVLQNTRDSPGVPVYIIAKDQVPESLDANLGVELHHPPGLRTVGDCVSSGTACRGTVDADWGEASATLKMRGEVHWTATLNPGKAVRLDLEYAVVMPGGNTAGQC